MLVIILCLKSIMQYKIKLIQNKLTPSTAQRMLICCWHSSISWDDDFSALCQSLPVFLAMSLVWYQAYPGVAVSVTGFAHKVGCRKFGQSRLLFLSLSVLAIPSIPLRWASAFLDQQSPSVPVSSPTLPAIQIYTCKLHIPLTHVFVTERWSANRSRTKA